MIWETRKPGYFGRKIPEIGKNSRQQRWPGQAPPQGQGEALHTRAAAGGQNKAAWVSDVGMSPCPTGTAFFHFPHELFSRGRRVLI